MAFSVRTFEPVEIEATLTAKRTVPDPTLFVGVLSLDNQRIAGVDFKDHAEPTPRQAGDRQVFPLQVDAVPLVPSAYRVELHAQDLTSGSIEPVPRFFPFSVVEAAAATERSSEQWYGHVGLRATAEVHTISASPGDEQ
jgi:hypothetical protein